MRKIYEDYPSDFDRKLFGEMRKFKDRENYCFEHLKEVGCGTSRRVFKIDDEKVLKLAINPAGISQNNAEFKIYKNNANYDVLPHFFSIDEVGGGPRWMEVELCVPATKNMRHMFEFFEKSCASEEDWKTMLKLINGNPFYFIYIILDLYSNKYHNKRRNPLSRISSIKKEFNISTQKAKSHAIAIDNINKEEEKRYSVIIDDIVENGGKKYDKSNFFKNAFEWIRKENPDTYDLDNPTNYGFVERNGIENLVLLDFGMDKETGEKFYSNGGLTIDEPFE